MDKINELVGMIEGFAYDNNIDCEIIWDKDHYYFEDNSQMSSEEYNKLRDELNKISQFANELIKEKIIKSGDYGYLTEL